MNEFLIDSLWQGALVTVVAALIVTLVPQRQAATRYAVWFAALLALAVLPMLSVWDSTQMIATPATPVVHIASAASRATAQAAEASGSWLVFAWLAGCAFFLLRLALSYARIRRIVRTATRAPQFGPQVMTSDRIAIPIAAGLFSTAIIIPTRIAASFERSDIDGIVQHERAHIARRDVAGNLIQRVLEAFLFFNPCVYIIGRQLLKEREAACDDWVVHESTDPNRYAACLAQLALGARRSRIPLLTPSAVGSKHVLVLRVARLLNGKVPQLKTNYLVLAASVASFAVLAVLLQSSGGLASVATAAGAGSCSVPHGYAYVQVKDAAPPEIPKSAYRPGLEATALVTVDAAGHPVSAKIVKSSGSAAVDHATVDAAMHSTYSPAMKACKPVRGSYYFHVKTGP